MITTTLQKLCRWVNGKRASKAGAGGVTNLIDLNHIAKRVAAVATALISPKSEPANKDHTQACKSRDFRINALYLSNVRVAQILRVGNAFNGRG